MPEILKSLLSSQTNLLWVTLISLVVSTVVSYIFRRWETRDRLETEYKYEQRKKLRELIGRYHGGVLYAAVSVNFRFFELCEASRRGGYYLEPNPVDGGRYFYSSVYRFMNVCSVIRQFEREALYVDGRIAEKRDFLFIKYLTALRLCMTDTALWKGLPYVDENETDHFFADSFREYCDSCIDEDGNFSTYGDFKQRVLMDSLSESKDLSLKPVLDFFRLHLGRDLKWDRLVAFHLILVGLINTFGYPEQEESEERIDEILSQIQHEEVLRNLLDWLPRRGLAQEPLTKMITRFIAAKHIPTLAKR